MAGFQVGPSQRDPNALRNPYLDEIDAAANNAHATLSPGAQAALQKAGAPLPTPPAPTPQITGPRPAPPTIGQPMSENMPNGQPAMMAGTGIKMPVPPTPVPQTAAAGPAQAEMTRLAGSKAGVDQIHNPWARVPLQILAGIGETFAPRLATALPGTWSHHNMLLGEAENAVKQQQGIRKAEEEAQTAASEQGLRGAQATNLEGEQPLHEAQTNEANARAWSLLNPAEKEKELNEFRLWHQQNPNAPVSEYLKLQADMKAKESGGTVHQDEAGNMWVVKSDGTAVPVTPKGNAPVAPQPVSPPLAVNGQPTPPTTVPPPGAPAQLRGKVSEAGDTSDYKNYQHDKAEGYKGTFQQWQNEDANRKAVRPAAESGTWSLQEDANGKPVLMNSKTGEMKAAPPGLQPRGTAAKDQPVKDALAYAEQYINGGKFSASGDLALMDQFYQAAKPKRMNEKQNQLLMQGQSIVQGIRQKALHALTPDAPYFDDTQRQNIVQTMRDLAKSQTTAAGGGNALPGGVTLEEIDAEIARRKKGK